MRSLVAAVACVFAGGAGCAQLLGLDNTKLEPSDAPIDMAGVCDAPDPSCTASSAGRSACGQVILAGTGELLRVATPTGTRCEAANTEGPCALQVSAVPLQSLFDGNSNGEVLGQIDDCGRFAVGDIDTSVLDVAIKFSDVAGAYQPSARLLINRTATAGDADRGIEAVAVLKTTVMEWSTQLAIPVENTSTGYLIRYTSQNGTPVVNEQVAIDNGNGLTSAPPAIPWAAYFGGTAAFGTIDPAAMSTAESGTAFGGMPAGPFSLQGVRMGRRCVVDGLKTVGNVLIHLVEDDC